jgi:DNA polymerase-1
MSSEKRLLLLDGHSLAYRAFFALPVDNFSTSTGQPTNAVYGFTSMLINTLRDEKPTHVAVAFDVSRQTFRTERFPDYKATRSASPVEFKGQVDLLREVLDAMGITALSREGYEADDIIATLATQAREQDFDVYILTGDRDTFQLVDDHTTVLYPRKGVSDLARMNPAAIAEKYGLSPSQYPDFAALRGDPSDNLPGIPGVGEKTATKWIQEFGSLAALVDRADEVTGKVGESLRAHVAQVLLNRDLTQLLSDVPLGVDVNSFDIKPLDEARIRELFDSLEFKTLRDRLFASQPTAHITAEVVVQPVDCAVLTGAPAIRDWFVQHAIGLTAVACEGSWGRGTGSLSAVGLCASDGSLAAIDLTTADTMAWAALMEWLGDDRARKCVHDAKGPILALLAKGVTLRGLELDTALASYLVAPGQRTDLEDVAQRLLGRTLGSATPSGQLELGIGGMDSAVIGSRAQVTAELASVLDIRVAESGGTSLLHDVELPLVGILASMEARGIAVNRSALEALAQEFGEQAADAQRDARGIAGKDFNLGSPKQLQEILFVELGLPKTKKIKTGFTTDAEALTGLLERTGHPLLEAILRWRDWTRMAQTVDGLLPLADAQSRIHTTFNQMVAATGRLSSTDPNLQNIPIRTETGRRIRDCFVVGDGYETLLTADYSQIELRIMAHMSQDAGLIAAFAEGEDLHTTMASRVFGVAADDVDAEMRRRIKAMSYGLAYGLSAYGLAQQLGSSPDEARRLMDDYFGRFGGVRDFLEAAVVEARKTGYTQTLLGRRRYLPDLTSDNRQRRDMAERMALNAPIQGSAADVIKVAMLEVEREIEARGLESRLLLQVHDELVVEVSAGELDEIRDVVVTCMEGATHLLVPLSVSVGVGPTWESAGH